MAAKKMRTVDGKIEIVGKDNEKELNVKQKMFIEEYFHNGMDAKLAYTTVYDAKTDDSIRWGVRNLMKNKLVAECLLNEHERFLAKNKIPTDKIIQNITEIEKDCRESKNFSQALKANELLLKCAGTLVPQTKTSQQSQQPSQGITINIIAPKDKQPTVIDITPTIEENDDEDNNEI